MILDDQTIGLVGGTGMLGKSIAGAILEQHVIPPERLWISNRRGAGDAFADHAGVHVTTSNQELADACDIIILSVPPASVASTLIDASDKLIISVMAGVSLDQLAKITWADRIVRAMSSPAARMGLAFSPWCATAEVTANDRVCISSIFEACGLSDEVECEEHIECFTAMTGPVPGFVAFYAKAMVDYAIGKGLPPEIADRAIRQLFLGAGTVMSSSSMTPAEHVEQMIDYAGTTAAGLEAMERSTIALDIAKGLDAAVARTRSIA